MARSSDDESLGRVERVILPWRPSAFVVVIHQALIRDECQSILSEAREFEPALLNTGFGRQEHQPSVRKSDRCIRDDPVTAATIWHRIVTRLQQHESDDLLCRLTTGPPGSNETAVGLNERLRILRYSEGDFFAPHKDGRYVRSRADCQRLLGNVDREGERSYVTCQVYLNDCTAGGETAFLPNFEEEDWNKHVHVQCQTGTVLLFSHNLIHAGCPVGKEGLKYTLRTDVMYTARGEGLEYSTYPIVLTPETTLATRKSTNCVIC